MREDIRRTTSVKNENSFYDVLKKRSFKSNQKYRNLAGIRSVSFDKVK